MKYSARRSFIIAWTMFLSLLGAPAAEAGPIMVLTGPGESGSGLTAGDTALFATQFRTGIDFQDSLATFSDLSNARFSLSGVQGAFNPATTGTLDQALQGGIFSLVSAEEELLLSGVLGLGALSASQGGTMVFSDQLLVTGGLFQNYYADPPRSIRLAFAGSPTAVYEDQITTESVFTGRYEQKLTGYQTVQSGTTRTLTGYRNGTLRCLDYHGFAGRGCIPVDANGRILHQYVGKWLLLSSTPTPTPVYNRIPVYETKPVYTRVPVYSQTPIYEQRTTVQHVFTGWSWNTAFAGGVILGGSEGTTTGVPEPASLALLGAALVPLARRRRLVC